MKSTKVKCKYVFDEDYNTKYVNGAQGGVNVQGEIIINFYLERHALPKSQTFKIDEIGAVQEELPEEAEPIDLNQSFIRYIQNGVIMNYAVAKQIHIWLGKHLETLENGNEKKI